jgi:hypothetical protein
LVYDEPFRVDIASFMKRLPPILLGFALGLGVVLLVLLIAF